MARNLEKKGKVRADSASSPARKKAVRKASSTGTARVSKKAAKKRVEPSAPEEPGFPLPSDNPETRRLLEDVVRFLEEKKIEDLRVMNLEEVNPYFCFFIIVTATSRLQLQSIARDISKRFGEHLHNKRLRPVDLESGWVIQDFIDIVLHIFLREEREYYNLEKLWGDAPTVYSSAEPRFRWPQRSTGSEG